MTTAPQLTDTMALEAWSFQWFDNEGSPAEEACTEEGGRLVPVDPETDAANEIETTGQVSIADWKTAIASVCPCGHGHKFVDHCTVEDCDCVGYRPSGIDLVFSPGAQLWGLRKGDEVTTLPLDRPRRTSRQARVAAIRSAAR